MEAGLSGQTHLAACAGSNGHRGLCGEASGLGAGGWERVTVPRPRPFGLLGEGAVDVGEAVSFRVSTNGPGLARPVLVSQDGPLACGHPLCCRGLK